MSTINKKKTPKPDVKKHENFMGGTSWFLSDPLSQLKMAASSCFFGEPMYYHAETGKKPKVVTAASSRLTGSNQDHVRTTLGAIDPVEWRSLSPSKMLETAIDAALAFDADATLAFAVELRNKDFIRTTPQVIMVRAANRKEIKGTNLISKYAQGIIRRPDETCVQLAYQTSTFGKPIPNSLKRAWKKALENFNEYQISKYRMESRDVKLVDVMNVSHPKGAAFDKLAKGELKLNDNTWESMISKNGSNKETWTKAVGVMGHMACFDESTPIWTADGTTKTIKEIVENKLNVLAYDKEWDFTPIKHGPHRPKRDILVGNLVESTPIDFIDNGYAECKKITFQSGREIVVTDNHRWATRRKKGIRSWVWKETRQLNIGEDIPIPLNAEFFGDIGTWKDGYVVGAMLGDGSMQMSPELSYDAITKIGTLSLVSDFAAELGCTPKHRQAVPGSSGPRVRFSDNNQRGNAFIDFLREYEVWGQKGDNKQLPNKPFSRDFVKGCLSGLIDTDGSVMLKKNSLGCAFIQIAFANTSKKLTQQAQDMFLKFGIKSIMRTRKIENRKDCYILEISDVDSIRSAHLNLNLQNNKRRENLDQVFSLLQDKTGKKSSKYFSSAYDNSISFDKVKKIEDVGIKKTYCVTVDKSNLFIVNGIVVGNCIRNISNLEKNGVDPSVFVSKMVDTAKTGKQLPFRYYSAYKHATSAKVKDALEDCLEISMSEIPKFPGKTISLCDNSGSAHGTMTSSLGEMQVSSIANLTGIVTAKNSDEGYVGVFGDRLEVFDIRKKSSVFDELKKIESAGAKIGSATENGIWLFFDKAIKNKEHWDNIFVYSDMQAGHGGLYGVDPSAYKSYKWQNGRNIDVAMLVKEYRKINPNVNVFLVQVAGYQDTLIPEYYNRTYILGGWGQGVLQFAGKMIEAGQQQAQPAQQ